jgi:hypothetical protein
MAGNRIRDRDGIGDRDGIRIRIRDRDGIGDRDGIRIRIRHDV